MTWNLSIVMNRLVITCSVKCVCSTRVPLVSFHHFTSQFVLQQILRVACFRELPRKRLRSEHFVVNNFSVEGWSTLSTEVNIKLMSESLITEQLKTGELDGRVKLA